MDVGRKAASGSTKTMICTPFLPSQLAGAPGLKCLPRDNQDENLPGERVAGGVARSGSRGGRAARRRGARLEFFPIKRDRKKPLVQCFRKHLYPIDKQDRSDAALEPDLSD